MDNIKKTINFSTDADPIPADPTPALSGLGAVSKKSSNITGLESCNFNFAFDYSTPHSLAQISESKNNEGGKEIMGWGSRKNGKNRELIAHDANDDSEKRNDETISQGEATCPWGNVWKSSSSERLEKRASYASASGAKASPLSQTSRNIGKTSLGTKFNPNDFLASEINTPLTMGSGGQSKSAWGNKLSAIGTGKSLGTSGSVGHLDDVDANGPRKFQGSSTTKSQDNKSSLDEHATPNENDKDETSKQNDKDEAENQVNDGSVRQKSKMVLTSTDNFKKTGLRAKSKKSNRELLGKDNEDSSDKQVKGIRKSTKSDDEDLPISNVFPLADLDNDFSWDDGFDDSAFFEEDNTFTKVENTSLKSKRSVEKEISTSKEDSTGCWIEATDKKSKAKGKTKTKGKNKAVNDGLAEYKKNNTKSEEPTGWEKTTRGSTRKESKEDIIDEEKDDVKMEETCLQAEDEDSVKKVESIKYNSRQKKKDDTASEVVCGKPAGKLKKKNESDVKTKSRAEVKAQDETDLDSRKNNEDEGSISENQKDVKNEPLAKSYEEVIGVEAKESDDKGEEEKESKGGEDETKKLGVLSKKEERIAQRQRLKGTGKSNKKKDRDLRSLESKTKTSKVNDDVNENTVNKVNETTETMTEDDSKEQNTGLDMALNIEDDKLDEMSKDESRTEPSKVKADENESEELGSGEINTELEKSTEEEIAEGERNDEKESFSKKKNKEQGISVTNVPIKSFGARKKKSESSGKSGKLAKKGEKDSVEKCETDISRKKKPKENLEETGEIESLEEESVKECLGKSEEQSIEEDKNDSDMNMNEKEVMEVSKKESLEKKKESREEEKESREEKNKGSEEKEKSSEGKKKERLEVGERSKPEEKADLEVKSEVLERKKAKASLGEEVKVSLGEEPKANLEENEKAKAIMGEDEKAKEGLDKKQKNDLKECEREISKKGEKDVSGKKSEKETSGKSDDKENSGRKNEKENSRKRGKESLKKSKEKLVHVKPEKMKEKVEECTQEVALDVGATEEEEVEKETVKDSINCESKDSETEAKCDEVEQDTKLDDKPKGDDLGEQDEVVPESGEIDVGDDPKANDGIPEVDTIPEKLSEDKKLSKERKTDGSNRKMKVEKVKTKKTKVEKVKKKSSNDDSKRKVEEVKEEQVELKKETALDEVKAACEDSGEAVETQGSGSVTAIERTDDEKKCSSEESKDMNGRDKSKDEKTERSTVRGGTGVKSVKSSRTERVRVTRSPGSLFWGKLGGIDGGRRSVNVGTVGTGMNVTSKSKASVKENYKKRQLSNNSGGVKISRGPIEEFDGDVGADNLECLGKCGGKREKESRVIRKQESLEDHSKERVERANRQVRRNQSAKRSGKSKERFLGAGLIGLLGLGGMGQREKVLKRDERIDREVKKLGNRENEMECRIEKNRYCVARKNYDSGSSSAGQIEVSKKYPERALMPRIQHAEKNEIRRPRASERAKEMYERSESRKKAKYETPNKSCARRTKMEEEDYRMDNPAGYVRTSYLQHGRDKTSSWVYSINCSPPGFDMRCVSDSEDDCMLGNPHETRDAHINMIRHRKKRNISSDQIMYRRPSFDSDSIKYNSGGGGNQRQSYKYDSYHHLHHHHHRHHHHTRRHHHHRHHQHSDNSHAHGHGHAHVHAHAHAHNHHHHHTRDRERRRDDHYSWLRKLVRV